MAIRVKKEFGLVLIFLIVSLFAYQFVSADIISLNSGGNSEVIVSVDKFVDGFFFGIPSPAAAAAASGDTTTSGTTGTSGTTPTTTSISLNPTSLNINIGVDTVQRKTISVTNLGSSSATVSVTQTDLNDLVALGSTSLTIPAGGTADLNVTFAAPSESGSYNGKIIIGGKEVLVTLNVYEGSLLFDSNIVVLNRDYTAFQGDKLDTLVTLIPVGEPTRVDITLNYKIIDYSNKIFFTKVETLFVGDVTELKRSFDTGALPSGSYILSLELIYPGGVAPSSAHFIIAGREIPAILGKMVVVLIVLILLVGIALLSLIIVRRIREGGQDVQSLGQNEF
ncbi:MAG: hypothetical protein KJ879_02960 [Nanoarchaeota archaeon]|nr:hypothetical protein [Nanoarchaeota archaeon]